MSIYFFTIDDVIKIHEIAIIRYGGINRIRDKNLLESAIAQPQLILFGNYVHEDIFLMAAAYSFHIIKNHPFIDGNKRTGMASALIFLVENGIKINATQDFICNLGVKIAESKVSKEEIAFLLKSHT